LTVDPFEINLDDLVSEKIQDRLQNQQAANIPAKLNAPKEDFLDDEEF